MTGKKEGYMSELLLGIDIGTSACKVAVFDTEGGVIAQTNESYRVYYPESGWAEQDPEEWWEAVCAAAKRVLSEKSISPEDIKAIGIDGQSWSAIAIDKERRVLCRNPIWMDTRARDICERVSRETGGDRIFEIAGNDFLPSYTTPKVLWYKENRPDVYSKIFRILTSNGFIAMKLTGELSMDLSQSYGLHFFNMKELVYDEELAEELGIPVGFFEKPVACDKIVGSVTKEASEKTGLCAGTPVVAGGLDAACGTLGAGVYKKGQTQEQGGQAGGMSICTDKALSHKKLILGTHVVPGLWLLQGGTVGGGGTLKWFRQEFMAGADFDELTALCGNIPPGSDGVVFLPYMAGERSPIWDPDAKGVFYGLSFDKTKGHMIRALMEGVAFSLEHNLRTAGETGVKVESMNAMGGSANSVLWTQIKADVTGKTINVPASDTATTLGAALLAGVGTGIYKDYEEAVKKTIRITRTQEPDVKNRAVYDRSMELYLELYEDLKGTFSKYK